VTSKLLQTGPNIACLPNCLLQPDCHLNMTLDLPLFEGEDPDCPGVGWLHNPAPNITTGLRQCPFLNETRPS
jgi:hypothetical protein